MITDAGTLELLVRANARIAELEAALTDLMEVAEQLNEATPALDKLPFRHSQIWRAHFALSFAQTADVTP